MIESIELGTKKTAPDKPPKGFRCRLGWHRWDKGRDTEDGHVYLICRLCGERGDDRPGPAGGYGSFHWFSN